MIKIIEYKDLLSCEVEGDEINYYWVGGGGGTISNIKGCSDANTTIEYDCEGNNLVFNFTNCPDTCQDGACIQ